MRFEKKVKKGLEESPGSPKSILSGAWIHATWVAGKR